MGWSRGCVRGGGGGRGGVWWGVVMGGVFGGGFFFRGFCGAFGLFVCLEQAEDLHSDAQRGFHGVGLLSLRLWMGPEGAPCDTIPYRP